MYVDHVILFSTLSFSAPPHSFQGSFLPRQETNVEWTESNQASLLKPKKGDLGPSSRVKRRNRGCNLTLNLRCLNTFTQVYKMANTEVTLVR